jgi:hypothetical protein
LAGERAAQKSGGRNGLQVEEESSFLKKRSKRLLFLRPRQDPGHGRNRGSGGEVKVFCFFSSEKKTLPYRPAPEIFE